MPARAAVILGRVQGVGFRMYVQSKAHELGIVGEVWNRLDGAVELRYSHSDESVLETLETALRLGPGNPASVSIHPIPDFEADDLDVGPTRP